MIGVGKWFGMGIEPGPICTIVIVLVSLSIAMAEKHRASRCN